MTARGSQKENKQSACAHAAAQRAYKQREDAKRTGPSGLRRPEKPCAEKAHALDFCRELAIRVSH
jgi:hypothetical protein